MSDLMNQITADGLTLSISEDGNLEIVGNQSVVDSWLDTIKENKAAILEELTSNALRTVTVTPQPRYTVTVEDATTDPVLVQVTINGLATFDLAIPLAKYDPFAIIDAMEHNSPMAALSSNLATTPLADENERTVGLPDEQEREAA
jgi:hypothetical protein